MRLDQLMKDLVPGELDRDKFSSAIVSRDSLDVVWSWYFCALQLNKYSIFKYSTLEWWILAFFVELRRTGYRISTSQPKPVRTRICA